MSVTGIIAEFNPLHKGHRYLLDIAKEGGNTVVCVISGNFVQRGDTAVIPKQKRAEAALRSGADLVAELPVLWSMSTAQNFATGSVAQLRALGCDEILFGSECGDIEELKNAARLLGGQLFRDALTQELKKGITFAAARQNAARAVGLESNVLAGANDNLGIEYISAAERMGWPVNFRCVKRMGAPHDSDEINNFSVSASLLREKLLAGDIGFAERFMPIETRGLINSDCLSDIHRLEQAILGVLRCKTETDFKDLPDLSEGIENKLFFSIRVATSLDELYNMIKTKRYTLARVRRLVLSAFLGLDDSFFLKNPPYVRILGFNKSGEAHLKNICTGETPLITRAAQIKQLPQDAQQVFAAECRATDLYALSLLTPQECGAEYKSKLLKTECLT